MNKNWIMLIIVAIVAYLIGVKYPAYGNTAISSASSLIS